MGCSWSSKYQNSSVSLRESWTERLFAGDFLLLIFSSFFYTFSLFIFIYLFIFFYSGRWWWWWCILLLLPVLPRFPPPPSLPSCISTIISSSYLPFFPGCNSSSFPFSCSSSSVRSSSSCLLICFNHCFSSCTCNSLLRSSCSLSPTSTTLLLAAPVPHAIGS